MKKLTIPLILLLFLAPYTVKAQEAEEMAKFYTGASYGTSYAIGNFRDEEVNNADAGFANNGQKIDLLRKPPFSRDWLDRVYLIIMTVVLEKYIRVKHKD